jgi:hypothetical protein
MTEVKPPKTLQETLYDKYIDKTAEYRTKGLKAGAYGAAILDIREKDKKAINKLKKRKRLKTGLGGKNYKLEFVNEAFLKPKPTRKPQTLDFLKPRNKRNKQQKSIT